MQALSQLDVPSLSATTLRALVVLAQQLVDRVDDRVSLKSIEKVRKEKCSRSLKHDFCIVLTIFFPKAAKRFGRV